jgi:uncharacterized protein (TIRG00374 family)
MVSTDSKFFIRSILIAFIVGLAVNVGIAFFLDFGEIFQSFSKVDSLAVLVPFFCYFLIYLVDSVRLKVVLTQFGNRISFGNAFFNSVSVVLFSNLTPFASGGQPYQVYHLTTVGIDSKKATNVVLSRHVEFMMTSVIIFLLGIPVALSIVGTMKVGREFFFLGFFVSLLFSVILLLTLIRPDFVGRLLLKIDRTVVGRFVQRVTKKTNWAEMFHRWSMELRRDVAFLWSEKLYIMILDLLLGFVNIILQAGSLVFMFYHSISPNIQALHFMVAFVIINLVVYYVPTPGGSGGVEGGYVLVFSGMTGAPGMTAVLVLIWRLSTYYLHIGFGLIVFFLKTYGDKQRLIRPAVMGK